MSAVVDINRTYRMDTSNRTDDKTGSIPDHTTCAEECGKRQSSPLVRQSSPLVRQSSPLNMYRARSRSPMDIYRARSRSVTPPPGSDSLSNLHRVTDMLKDKLNNGSDIGNSLNANTQELNGDRKSPYSSNMLGKSVNGCVMSQVNKMDNYAIGLAAQHHMSLLLGNEMYNNDSNVLRGILQGKDRMFDSDNKMHSNRRYPEYRRHLDGEMSRNESIEGESLDSFRSGSPGNLSYDGDPDRRINGISDMDEIMETKDNDNCYLDKDLDDSSIHTDDEDDMLDHVLDTKKFQVDNLDSVKCHDGQIMPPERRPKRKQYIPQQHGSQETSPKRKKVEKEFLQKQLRHMQDQLAVMQQRYCSLFDQGDMSDLEGGPDGPEGARMSADDKERSKLCGPLSSLDFDPSHFIKQASQLVQEQELLSKNSRSSPLRGKTPTDITSLAKMLKEEITHSVGSLVDTVVAKFVEKHQKALSNTSLPDPAIPVASMDKPLKKERIPSPVTEPTAPKSKSPGTVPNNNNNNNNNNIVKDVSHMFHNKFMPQPHMSCNHREDHGIPKPPRTKVTDKITHPFFDFPPHKPFADLLRAHPALFPPPPYFPSPIPHIQPLYAKEPEQTEPMALVVGTPTKKKRTKVTDTRLSPRAARALLQENIPHGNIFDTPKHSHHMGRGSEGFPHPPLIPMSLPTSVAIPNPSLQHSDILAMYPNSDMNSPFNELTRRGHSPSSSPNMNHSHLEAMQQQMNNEYQAYEHMMQDSFNADGKIEMTTTLTPMHLRKAKLMFFYTRYPSSSILKIYFPDVKFNKNNTAQLVKWFSNFREFFYIQMEKYSRQALAEGVKNPDELMVSGDSEIYRILNLHYNRNNQIDVPDAFRHVVQSSLREFFRAVQAGKDTEQSWKKAIYKVIARMDDSLPEYFKSVDWMEQLHDA